MAKKFRVPVKKMAGGALVGDAPMQVGDAIRWAMNNPAEAAKMLGLDKYASGRGIASSISKTIASVPAGSRERAFKEMEALRARVMTDPRLYSDKVEDAAVAAAGPFMSRDFGRLPLGSSAAGPATPADRALPPTTLPSTPQQAAARPTPLSAPGKPIPPQMQRPTPPQQAAMGIGVTPGAINFPGSTPPPAQAPMPYMGPGPEAGLPGLDRASIGMPVEGGGEAALAALNGNLSAPTAPGMTPGMAEMVASAAPQSLMPQKGKDGMDWKKMLMYAGLAGLIGKTGIGTAGAGIMGGLLPLAGALLEKRGKKKTAKKAETKTEAKAKGGQVMAKKSAKKFGGASKAAPKFAKKAAPAMPAAMPPPMAADIPMKCGGKVKRMASGGLVARGMGAATKGGGFKSC
jgi:hypothetical protein